MPRARPRTKTGLPARRSTRSDPGLLPGPPDGAGSAAAGDDPGRGPHRLPDRRAAPDRGHGHHARLPAHGRPGDAARDQGRHGRDGRRACSTSSSSRSRRRSTSPALEPFLAAGAELGARHVITAPYDPDLARLADRLGRHRRAWRPLRAQRRARVLPLDGRAGPRHGHALVEATGRAEIGILVDTLHFARSGSTLEQLDARSRPSRLPFVHVCDAPAEKPTTTEGLLHARPRRAAAARRRRPRHRGRSAPHAARHPDRPGGADGSGLTREVGPEEVARRVREAGDRLLAETTLNETEGARPMPETTPCIITVAITGSLPRKENNPAVPITIAEQVEIDPGGVRGRRHAGASARPQRRPDARPPTRRSSRG